MPGRSRSCCSSSCWPLPGSTCVSPRASRKPTDGPPRCSQGYDRTPACRPRGLDRIGAAHRLRARAVYLDAPDVAQGPPGALRHTAAISACASYIRELCRGVDLAGDAVLALFPQLALGLL